MSVHAGTAMDVVGRIGPNAITRVAEVLPTLAGSGATLLLFERAGLARYLVDPPQGMVDEAEVTRLHREMRTMLGAEATRQVSQRAGTLTGNYLLAHRIPKPVQAVLKLLPAALAAQVLLSAIRRHAWTFAGSGHFTAKAAWASATLVIRDNPLCRGMTAEEPMCDFYTATFQRLFEVLVRRGAKASETACEASGDAECRFELTW